jgi:hypothetical protein
LPPLWAILQAQDRLNKAYNNNKSIKRKNLNQTTMRSKLLIIGLLLAICSCQAQTYKFAVICDTRSNANKNGISGVNVPAIKAVCNHLKRSGAEFVIAPGDFICGNVRFYDTIQGPPSNHKQYKTFLYAAQSAGVTLPGETGGLKMYPVRGNHECYHQILPKDSIEAAWLKNIGNTLPKNGPEGEIGFTYSFEYNGSLFLALDQYMYADASQTKGIAINQKWLDKELQEYPDVEHVFAFGHTPAFAANHQDCLGEDSLSRNIFLQSLVDRSGVYFCGHDHFYARANIPVYNPNGGIENYMQQVITPSGAPFLGDFSPKWNGVYKNKDVKVEKYIDNTLGYQLVTVNGYRVNVKYIATKDACIFYKDDNGKYHYTYNDNWESWNFEVWDEFSYELSGDNN